MSLSGQLEYELNQSLPWMTGQRWYGDKSRTLLRLIVEHSTSVTGGREPVVFCIVRCDFSDGGFSRYFLPVVGIDQGGMRDAFTEEHFRSWFFEGFVRDRTIETDDGIWGWSRTGQSDAVLRGVRSGNSTLLRREQSNSSIIYDDRLIAKVFRKLEPGQNPDVEIGTMFASTAANVHTPHMVGALNFEHNNESTVGAILQQYVHNRGDGWSWLLDELRYRPSLSHSAVRLLGHRTAEMHIALASSANDPAFEPEPISRDDLEQMRQRLRGELAVTMSGLKSIEAKSRDEIDHLSKNLGDMLVDLDAFRGIVKIRVHGDYHLGQVLRTVEDDFSIIDFEGEPSRPMAERRQKWPALRDVAGMVRSLDYAIQTVIREQPERSDLNTWLGDATKTFIAGYKSIISPQTSLVPTDENAFDSALAILSIEKALYETRYEMDNRPDWLAIPLGALQRIASR